MRGDQLGLLLWKNYVVRKRRPAILGLVFLWPVAVFLLLYTVRDNVDPEYKDTCQFPSRLMPHDGLLPFVQSYICSIGNTCESFDEYEEVPSYKNSTLGPLMMELQPILTNQTILQAVRTLPKSIQLLKSMAQILTRPEIKQLFDRGIRLGDLFNNHEAVKSVLKTHLPRVRNDLIDDLLNASVKLYYLIETFGSTNLDGVICSPESLKNYLIVRKDADLREISSIMCNIEPSKIPRILDRLTRHLDFGGLLEMVSRVMAKFREYDFIDDLVRAINTILDLRTAKKYIPEELKLREWLPKIVPLFRGVSPKEIDLSINGYIASGEARRQNVSTQQDNALLCSILIDNACRFILIFLVWIFSDAWIPLLKGIDKMIEQLDPLFDDNPDWSAVRRSLQNTKTLIATIDNLVMKKKESPENALSAFNLTKSMGDEVQNISARLHGFEDVTKILDNAFVVLKDAAKITSKIIDRNEDKLMIVSDVLDGLRDFFPQNVLNTLSYMVSMAQNIVRVTHHVATIHEEIGERLYNVSYRNMEIVKKMLTKLEPEAYPTFLQSISRLNFTERLVDDLRKTKPEDLLCQEDVMKEMFQGFKDFNEDSTKIRELFCNEAGKVFVAELYEIFDFDDFRKNVDDTLSTFVSMALGQPVRIEKSNLTSLVTSVKNLMVYLEKVSVKKPDWSIFESSEKWNKVFRDSRIQGRIDVLGIHLSIAKATGSRSVSYFTIKPDLEQMDFIADMILVDLRAYPTSWIGQVREHESEILESFWLTVADRTKTLNILEYSNFTGSYCTDKNPPDLINYPQRSNSTLLKDLVCRLAKSAENTLRFNRTEFEASEEIKKNRPPFNWTGFNEKTLKIYEYIETLLPQIDENYDEERLAGLRKKFVESWTKDLAIREAWEISVGSFTKFFDIIESPVFDVRARTSWEVLYPIGRAGSLLVETITRVVAQIQGGNRTLKLSEMFQDLPETEILLDVFLRNFASLTYDVVKISASKSSTNYVKFIQDYMKEETIWPCVQNRSIGAVLGLSDRSRKIIEAIEKIACDPKSFVSEWTNHTVFAKVRKVLDKNSNDFTPIPPFNWTEGYSKFRRLMDNIDSLMSNNRSSTGLSLDYNNEKWLLDADFLPRIRQIIDNNIPDVEKDPKNVFEFLDNQIDKNVEAFNDRRSAADAWMSIGRKRDMNDFLIIGKFLTRAIHGFTGFVWDILKPNSPSIDLINLMGFTNRSAVSILYERLPYIVAMVINGMSDPTLDSRAYNETQDRDHPITCSDVFSWFSEYRIGLTVEEYLILKNSTCDRDPENFNAYTDFYLSLIMIWHQPVSQYRGYFLTLASEMWRLSTEISGMVNLGTPVKTPFGDRYLQNFVTTLKNSLTIGGSTIVSNHYANSSWWTYRLVIEGVSEVLHHAVTALKDVKPEADAIYMWDLVESGDVRQLVKILESYPVETISIAANLATFDSTMNSIVSFKDLRRVVCVERFGSSKFWKTENRTRFLDRLCSFDVHQLLRRATSDEFYEAAVNKSPIMRRVVPLSRTITKFLDTLMKLRGPSGERKKIVSNILNATTWTLLPDDTRGLVHEAEKSWARKMASSWRENNGEETGVREVEPDGLVTFMQLQEIVGFLLDMSGGGDVWTKWKTSHENPRSKALFLMIEDLPNLAITFVDTFINSERLADYTEKFIAGTVNGCDIDKYLIPPGYIRRKGFLSSIANFCQKFVYDNRTIAYGDLLPMEFYLRKVELGGKQPDVKSGIQLEGNVSVINEDQIFREIEKIESAFVRLMKDGTKAVKVPSWWTSFEAGTWVDFSKQYTSKDPKPLAHTIVGKVVTLFKDIIGDPMMRENCTWCNSFLVQILNSQLSRHEMYSNLLCNMSRMNYSSVREAIDRDLYWNKTINMIKGYEYLSQRSDPKTFVSSVKDAVQYVTDIIIDYKSPATGRNLTECFLKAVGASKRSGVGFYVKILMGLVELLERNVAMYDTATTHQNLLNLTRMAETFVPIWQPLRTVVRESEVQRVDKILPNASIDVNYLISQHYDSHCSKLQDCIKLNIPESFLNQKRSKKLLRYDEEAADYPSVASITKVLEDSLDLAQIDRKIGKWRREASWKLTWLREILKDLGVVIEEGGSLLDVASKIDFQDVSNVLGVPDIADGVLNLLKDKTIDKLFAGLKELVENAAPFIADEEIKQDLRAIVEAFESMEIFKNLGLLDLKYVVSEMFLDWNSLRHFLVDEIGIPIDVTSILGDSRIDMLSVFMKERNAISFKDTVCSPSKLQDMLSFESGQASAEDVSEALCKLDDAATTNVTIELIKNLNFDYMFTTLMSANVKNILKNANLTEMEGQEVFDSIGVAAELVPLFKGKLTSDLSVGEESKDGMVGETSQAASSGRFLQDASKMLCGKALISDSGDFYRVIKGIEDNKKAFDQKELDSLPTDFCRETYKNFVSSSGGAGGGGKIIWSYVKPLLRGQILYAPNSTTVTRIMGLANETFSQMGTFGDLIGNFGKSLRSLANLSEMGQSLNDLKDIMASKVMKIAIKSMSGGRLQGDFSDFDLGDVAWRIKKSRRMVDMVDMLNDFMKCVLVDRVKGFATEEELESEARRLTDTNEFLAGVVFLDQIDENNRLLSKRSLDDALPEHITYKIRMDVDYVPTTKRLRTQFWRPGPEDSFIEDLRYLRGFIQLQDSIDRAIIREKSGEKFQNWKTVTQQMPYPCWKRTPFITTLYESQGVIVCFYFALMMCAGSAVRYIVWDRESQNAMVMSVMGLKPWRNTLAWFVTTYIELTIVMVSICIILFAGKILPHSNPSLVLVLLLDYVFALVTFCYMISTMFSSASLAAVTTVVMFLLTYMPYVIVIAMEASMSLGWKIFICLSMSTSFSYGCLYTVRREVQGTGLTWNVLWDESSPGDPMSLGLILIMIALDGMIYALIGYFISRYTNSGRDFRGLRSRSLWWAGTRSLYGRPSYLAFVNSLYFTNDVLHPSATYQDEASDPGSMIISEKQIGVRFEGVRKVFSTEKRELVAVDDFTLKLNDGEVTSLLGRNGAGKTTIIKMLTGMLTPTSGEIFLNGDEGTKPDIGVCPQDNVLIDTLTPREHMIFYARLKKPLDEEAMLKNVNSMLASLELGRQEHEPVKRLSGGTKRRLCVALAFLGSPKLVILDEPGAGVDPAARRRIWRLIDQHRVDRTVLLSTHHLDEADMLSDTVVVMHRGKILCTGSPLSLKLTHGHGYWLHVEFPIATGASNNQEISADHKRLENIRSMIESVVPNATFNEASAREFVITLPFHGKHGETNDISAAAKVLEDNKKILGFTHISLECDSLERVFLDLSSQTDSGNSVSQRVNVENIATNNGPTGFTVRGNDVDLTIGESVQDPKPLRQVRALLKKRFWHFTRDWRSPLATLVLPTLFVAVAMGFSLIRPSSGDEPALDLSPKLYDTHPTYFYSMDDKDDQFLRHVSLELHNRFGGDYAGAWQTHPNDTGICKCNEGQQVCHGVSKAVEGLYQTMPGRPTLDWIVSTFGEYIEKRYGGWSLSHASEDPLFVVWYNNKGHHALPAYLNALNEAILRASGTPGHLTTLNHPLKLSSDQLNRTTLVQHVADVGVALVLLVAFSLVAAQGTRELVRERLSEEKRILYLAGVHPVTYWTTALIWDFLIFLVSIVLAVIVFEIFGLSTYVARDNLAAVCLLLVLFAWAAIPFTHLAEKSFDDSSLSNMVLFCINTFVGVTCLATILVIDILGKSQTAKDTRNFLHHALLLLPQYALGDALVEITKNDITAELLSRFQMDTYKSPLGWELIGLHYVVLFFVGVVFYVANLVIECGLLPVWPSNRTRTPCENVQEDEDVIRERIRVENGDNGDAIRTYRLRKEYRSVYGTNVAVQNLSFGAEAGSCFGLLGVNGAGKSSTFRMLTTEIRPTSGDIIFNGRSIGKRPLCNGEIGYCPQTDALDGFLTPHESLTVHGEICGLDDVAKAVESMLKRFDLTKYAHQRVSSLSGGNKRKLCAAISVMSPVSVVLMDEPTSGMDPASKELVARAVREVTRNHGCVIMTSHSVSECENLCNRVGILAKAGLRCIGTVQHLKHKFGEGYVAFLRFGLPITLKDLKDSIARHLPTALVSSRQAMTARLLIPRSNDATLSSTFTNLRRLAEDLKATDYTLTQSSLDQVLVNLSAELEDETLDPRYGQRSRAVPNNYTTVPDTIHMETF